jgi:hypothetical protein
VVEFPVRNIRTIEVFFYFYPGGIHGDAGLFLRNIFICLKQNGYKDKNKGTRIAIDKTQLKKDFTIVMLL